MTPWQRRFWEKAEAAANEYVARLAKIYDDLAFARPDLEELEDAATEAVTRAIRKAALVKGQTVGVL